MEAPVSMVRAKGLKRASDIAGEIRAGRPPMPFGPKCAVNGARPGASALHQPARSWTAA